MDSLAIHTSYNPRRSARTALPAGLLLAGLGACDLPSELPRWNTLWVVPAGTTEIDVASLLPDQIGVTSDGSAFQMSLSPFTFSRSVGEICPNCPNGVTIPKPEFTASFGGSTSLPSEVISANVSGGNIRVRLQHNFSFDPLRPGGSSVGHIVLVVRSGGATLARDSISGNATALPAGTALDRTVTLQSATITGPIQVDVNLFSPSGGTVTINTGQRLDVTVTPNNVRISEARVRVPTQTVEAVDEELDFEDIDEDTIDRIKGGAIRLGLENPFSVSGQLQLRITGPGIAPIVRTVNVAQGTSTSRIEFTADEIRSILGRSGVLLNIDGTLTAPATGTRVRPTDAVAIETQLEVIIGPVED